MILHPGGDFPRRNAANNGQNGHKPRDQPLLRRRYDSILIKIDEFLPRLSLTGIHRRRSSKFGHIGPKCANQTKNRGRRGFGGGTGRPND